MSTSPIPAGFSTVTPYLLVQGVPALLAFLEKAFAAERTECTELENGTIMHAQVRIGDSMVMMGESPGDEWKPMPGFLYVYVEDADSVYAQALAAGGTSVQEPRDEFYGDRTSGVKDPCGNLWWIATHVEDVAPDEIARRAAAARNA